MTAASFEQEFSREPAGNAGTRHRLGPLIGIVLLCGCGRGALSSDYDRQAKLESCSPNPLVSLKPAIQVDAVELRMVCRTPNPPGATARALRSSGSSCASDACAADVEALDVQLQGWRAERPPAQPCKQYLVGMRENRVVASARTDAELRNFLGPIDTRAEAELIATVHEITCVRSGQDGGRFVIASVSHECSDHATEQLYTVDAHGAIDILPQKAADRACVEDESSKASRSRTGQSVP
jgi:hypothetical protein